MAEGAHCSSDNKPCSRNVGTDRESLFVDVKSLLDDAIFPTYRPRILNPIRESDSLQKFRPDPDVNSPRSFSGFIQRVATFQPYAWGADPNAALYFAKHGWRATTDFNIHCKVCSTSIDCAHAVKKGPLWFLMGTVGHNALCPFQFISTCDDLFKLPTDPEVIMKNVTKIWGSLITLGTYLPSITEEVISDLGIENKVVELFFKALESPVTEFGFSALVLALCGWAGGDTKNTVEHTIECNFCQRRVGLWNFFSIADRALPPPQEELLPSSSSQVHDKPLPSPKQGSPSICSEQSPSQEILPSDCEVPLDSNDYVSEECSEGSDGDMIDDGEEEEDYDDEESDYEQIDVAKSTVKSRLARGRREMFDSNSEDPSDISDEEVASTSHLGSYAGYRGSDRNPYSVDSTDLLERDRIIQLARKIKKRALARSYRNAVRFIDYKSRFCKENTQNNVNDSFSNVSSNETANLKSEGITLLALGQPVDTTLISRAPYSDVQEVEDDESDMEWNRENERALEETNLDEVCNGSAREELPDSNFKLVLDCPSSSEADEGSMDPLDTHGIKRTCDVVQDEEDVKDPSFVKRRKVGGTPEPNEIRSIGECTLVNVKDITSRLSMHGVTITKCPSGTETKLQERGMKRKAQSIDLDEETEMHITSQRPRKDLDTNETVDGLPSNDVAVLDLKNEVKDSKIISESKHISKESCPPVSQIDAEIKSELSKKTLEGSKENVEIPMDMRNGIDSSKQNNSENNSNDSMISNKEDCSSNQIVEHVQSASNNKGVKNDSTECKSTPKISNGDSVVLSPDVTNEEKSTSDRPNGKSGSESLCNSTSDLKNEVKDMNGPEISVKKTNTEAQETKTIGNSESLELDNAGIENHVEGNMNQCEGSEETSVSGSIAKSPSDQDEKRTNHPSSDSGISETNTPPTEDSSKISDADQIPEKGVKVESPQNKESNDVASDLPSSDVSGTDGVEAEKLDSKDVGDRSESNALEHAVGVDKLDSKNVATNSETKSPENKPVPDSVKESSESNEELKPKEDSNKTGELQTTTQTESKENIVEEKESSSNENIAALESNEVQRSCSSKDDIGCESLGGSSESDVKKNSENQGDINSKETGDKEQLVGGQGESTTVNNDGVKISSEVLENIAGDMDVDTENMKPDTKTATELPEERESKELDNANVEDKRCDDMDVSEPPELPISGQNVADGTEEKSADGVISEETTSRKRTHSSMEEGDEIEEEKDDTKKFKACEPTVKKEDFHPLKEHRFWCIYRLDTTSSSGDAKPGWKQIRDGLRLGLSMEFASCNREMDLNDFRMRLAKHLAHW